MGNVATRDIYDKSGPKTGPGLDTLAKNQGAMREGVGLLPPKGVTIQDGAITGFEEAALIVDTEGGAAADDLNVISDVISSTEKLHPGMLITLRAKDPARVVTIKNSAAANGINTADGNDIVLSPYWELTLRLVGGKWYEVRGRSGAQADAALGAASAAQSTANNAKTVTDKVTTTPAPNAVPQANEEGKLTDGWLLRAAPTGLSGFYAGDTPPVGWLEENGAAVSRTTYANLFAIIGTRYGAGNGSTTFNLPDSRGYAKRVWDHGRGIDSGRTLGSTQSDHVQKFSGDTGPVQMTADTWASGILSVSTVLFNNAITANPSGGDARRNLHIEFGSGNETVMKNMSYMGIIKY